VMNTAHDYIGIPICAVLKDGTYHYGVIRSIQGNQILMQGFKAKKKLSKNKKRAKAQIAALGGIGNMLGMLGGLGGMFGGGIGGPAGFRGMDGLGQGFGGGAGGGFMNSMGSWMKIGMGVLSFIMPLMRGFSI
jgi:hypothetical protein